LPVVRVPWATVSLKWKPKKMLIKLLPSSTRRASTPEKSTSKLPNLAMIPKSPKDDKHLKEETRPLLHDAEEEVVVAVEEEADAEVEAVLEEEEEGVDVPLVLRLEPPARRLPQSKAKITTITTKARTTLNLDAVIDQEVEVEKAAQQVKEMLLLEEDVEVEVVGVDEADVSQEPLERLTIVHPL